MRNNTDTAGNRGFYGGTCGGVIEEIVGANK
jgi:hypothetical protein